MISLRRPLDIVHFSILLFGHRRLTSVQIYRIWCCWLGFAVFFRMGRSLAGSKRSIIYCPFTCTVLVNCNLYVCEINVRAIHKHLLYALVYSSKIFLLQNHHPSLVIITNVNKTKSCSINLLLASLITSTTTFLLHCMGPIPQPVCDIQYFSCLLKVISICQDIL